LLTDVAIVVGRDRAVSQMANRHTATAALSQADPLFPLYCVTEPLIIVCCTALHHLPSCL